MASRLIPAIPNLASLNHRGCAPRAIAGVIAALWCTAAIGQDRVTRSFPVEGIERVVFRAGEAATARVTERPGKLLSVSGATVGGAKGYHSSDPSWKETPATEWGLDFVSRQIGNTLIVSTRNEIRYIHHYYAFSEIAIDIPPGIALVREKRELTGNGAPDLEPPKPGP